MKQQSYDVIICSAFGRGNWPAIRLANSGLRVALVDMSEAIGPWTAEDIEGPFGFFQSEHLTDKQLRRLNDDGPNAQVENGFTMLLKDGPLELKGPLLQHRLERLGVSEELREFLSTSELVEPSDEKLETTASLPFKEKWLVHLAYNFSSNVEQGPLTTKYRGQPLPLFAPYFTRQVSEGGKQLAFDACTEAGVDVFANFYPEEFSMQKGLFSGMRLADKSKRKKELSSKSLIWCLSSIETEMLSEQALADFFPSGVLKPNWYWERLQLSVDSHGPYKSLPKSILILEDLNLPWTHENFLVLEKTDEEGVCNVWCKLPYQQRESFDYIQLTSDKIAALLSERLVGKVKPNKTGDETRLGIPCFVVYNAYELAGFSERRRKNIYYDNPENWLGHDWRSRFSYQEIMIADLLRRALKSKKELNEVRK